MTTSNLSFNPDWVSPPGSTLIDFIENQGKSLSEFASGMQWGANELKKLIKMSNLILDDITNPLI